MNIKDLLTDESRTDYNMAADEAKAIAMAILNPFDEGLDEEGEDDIRQEQV